MIFLLTNLPRPTMVRDVNELLMNFPQVINSQLQSMRMIVVGAGALGSGVCRLLAENGITKVLIVDSDFLEPRNISFSPLYQEVFDQCGPSALQRNKAELLAGHVRQRFSLPWSSLAEEIADGSLGA